jgi:hypothetical protein
MLWTDTVACHSAALISDSEKTMSGNLPRVSPLLTRWLFPSVHNTSCFVPCAASEMSSLWWLHMARRCARAGLFPACCNLTSLKAALQDYHVDNDGNVVPLPNTGSPLISANQMSHAKVRSTHSAQHRRVHFQASNVVSTVISLAAVVLVSVMCAPTSTR